MKVAPSLTKLLQSDRMWNDVTTLVRAVYPGLLLLRMADKKTPAMDRLYYYVRQMDTTMERSKKLLDDIESKYKGANNRFSNNKMFEYFLQTTEITDYCNEFGNKINDDDDDSVSSVESGKANKGNTLENETDTDEDDEPTETVSLGDRMKARWDLRKKKLINDLSICGWMTSPMPEIMRDVLINHDGEHRNAVERILKKWILYDVSELFFCFFWRFYTNLSYH
jgi:hypothetical protein